MMRMMQHRFVLAATLVAVLPALASAADGDARGIKGRWSVSLQGGTDVELAGDYYQAAQGAVLGLPTSVESGSFKDVYGHSFRGGISLGYGVSSNLEVFGRGGHYGTEANTVPFGTAATIPVQALFGKYTEWGGEAGVRYLLSPAPAFKPYVAGVAGVRFVSAVPVSLSGPAANVVLSDMPFYDQSTVGVFGADLGATYDLARHVAIGAEIGLRFQTRPSGIDTGLAGTGFETINDGGSRWSLPVLGQVVFRF
jgi:hypothetical protein